MLGQEVQIEEEEEVECGVDVLGVRSLFPVSALVLRPRAAFRIDLAMESDDVTADGGLFHGQLSGL